MPNHLVCSIVLPCLSVRQASSLLWATWIASHLVYLLGPKLPTSTYPIRRSQSDVTETNNMAPISPNFHHTDNKIQTPCPGSETLWLVLVSVLIFPSRPSVHYAAHTLAFFIFTIPSNSCFRALTRCVFSPNVPPTHLSITTVITFDFAQMSYLQRGLTWTVNTKSLQRHIPCVSFCLFIITILMFLFNLIRIIVLLDF